MNDRQITGNVGVFYACYKLSLYGWNAMPTIRNAKGADIIIVKDEKRFGIQVKTLSSNYDVPLGNNYNDKSVDYWVVIFNLGKEEERTKLEDEKKVYVIPKKCILAGIDYCKEDNKNTNKNLIYHDNPNKDGYIRYWINKGFLLGNKNNDSNDTYLDAWYIIGEDYDELMCDISNNSDEETWRNLPALCH